MPKQSLALPLVVSMLGLIPLSVAAGEEPVRLAMMDMMPMAPSAGAMPGMPAAPPSSPAPMAGAPMSGMDDDMMRMGGAMPAQAQAQMPMGMPMGGAQQPAPSAGAMPAQGQMPMAQQPMAGCPMMAMMQNMMRPSNAQQGMAPMQGGAASASAMSAMPGGMESTGSSAARLEGRIAFLRTELRITGAQTPTWESFATALRAGREHLDAARSALQDSSTNADPMARLESYENHLKARTEAIHTTRMAFSSLFDQLDDAQKRMATSTMLPFIGAF